MYMFIFSVIMHVQILKKKKKNRKDLDKLFAHKSSQHTSKVATCTRARSVLARAIFCATLEIQRVVL